MTTGPTFFSAQALAFEDLGAGIQRRITGHNSDLMMVEVVFETGSVGAPHSHPHTQTTYVAEGVFEVLVGDQQVTLSKGDSIFIQPNEWHGVTCKSAGALIDVFTPRRDDFLENNNE